MRNKREEAVTWVEGWWTEKLPQQRVVATAVAPCVHALDKGETEWRAKPGGHWLQRKGVGWRDAFWENDCRLHNPASERGTERASHRPKATQLCPSRDLSPSLTQVSWGLANAHTVLCRRMAGLASESEKILLYFSITANTLHPSVNFPVWVSWVFQGYCTLWCFANRTQKPDHRPFYLTNVSTWVSGTQLLLSPWCKSPVGFVMFVAKCVFLHSPLMSYKGTVQAWTKWVLPRVRIHVQNPLHPSVKINVIVKGSFTCLGNKDSLS